METETPETSEAENAEESEGSELGDAGAMVEDIVTAEQVENSGKTADTGSTGSEVASEAGFVPTDAQILMAKQLRMTDDEIADMTEAEAFAIDKVARKESRLQQLRGTQAAKTVETPASEESSTDDEKFFTEDDLYTPEGIDKINALHRRVLAQEARGKKQETSDNDRLQVKYDEVFDELDPEIFPDFFPGESNDIKSGSPAETRRNEVVTMAKAIAATRDAQGGEISLEQSMQNALSILAPTETQNAAQNEAKTRRKKRGKQRISAPSTSLQSNHVIQYDTPEKKAEAEIMAELTG